MKLVTGATGFLGNRVAAMLAKKGFQVTTTSRSLGVDMLNRDDVFDLFSDTKPEHVFHCAAFVGGIQFGYKYPADMFSKNILMFINLLDACKEFKVKRLINPISNCTYPADAKLFREDEFWDGPLHESVLAYGFARKASWVGSWSYAKQFGLDTGNIILSNMYGPGDHFDETRSHAMGALIMKTVSAYRSSTPNIVVWGSGKPVREWLFVDDGAEAMIKMMDAPATVNPINIGVGKGISILDMVQLIKDIVGYKGEILFDASKPDGAPFKTVDGTRGKELLGWSPEVTLKDGIVQTVKWYIDQLES